MFNVVSVKKGQHVLALTFQAEDLRFEKAELHLPLGVATGVLLALFFRLLLSAGQVAAQDLCADIADDGLGIPISSVRRTIPAAGK